MHYTVKYLYSSPYLHHHPFPFLQRQKPRRGTGTDVPKRRETSAPLQQVPKRRNAPQSFESVGRLHDRIERGHLKHKQSPPEKKETTPSLSSSVACIGQHAWVHQWTTMDHDGRR